MKKNNQEFYKTWRLGFKYLFIVMLALTAFRTLVSFMTGNGDSITLSSILLGILFLVVGTGLLTLFIAWYSMRGK
jgi:hypothetical protein